MARLPKNPQKAGDATSSWMRVKIGEAHAKSIADLAAFETDLRQDQPDDAIPVYVTVACGRPSLAVGDTTFKLATWQVLLRIDLENAKIKFGSVPSVKVQDGSFQSQSSTKTTLLTVREHAAVLGLNSGSLKVSRSTVSATGSLFAKLSRKKSEKLRNTATGTTKTVTEIVLIGPFGPSVIAIGDPDYGDPHKLHGLLGHNYPKEQDDDIKPLFILEPDDPCKSIKITMTAAIPSTSCACSRMREMRRSKDGRVMKSHIAATKLSRIMRFYAGRC